MAKEHDLEVIPRATKHVVAITVRLEVMTPDRLKRMVFGFSKGTKEGVDTWTIDFELYTRDNKSAEFGDALVKLDVDVSVRHEKKAEDTALKGMTRDQVAFAITRAAPTAERFSKGRSSEKLAKKRVAEVVSIRA